MRSRCSDTVTRTLGWLALPGPTASLESMGGWALSVGWSCSVVALFRCCCGSLSAHTLPLEPCLLPPPQRALLGAWCLHHGCSGQWLCVSLSGPALPVPRSSVPPPCVHSLMTMETELKPDSWAPQCQAASPSLTWRQEADKTCQCEGSRN